MAAAKPNKPPRKRPPATSGVNKPRESGPTRGNVAGAGGQQEANKLARVIIPLAGLAIGIAMAAAFLIRGNPSSPPNANTPTPPAEQVAQDTPPATPDPTPVVDPAPPPTPTPATQPEADPTPEVATPDPTPAPSAEPPADTPAARFTVAPPANPATGTITIGSTDPASGFSLEVELSPKGAGVRKITLANYTLKVLEDTKLVVAEAVPVDGETAKPLEERATITPFAARSLTLNGKPLTQPDNPAATQSLLTADWSLDAQAPDHATFSLTLTDANGSPVAKVLRTYRITPGPEDYDVQLDQQLINLTDKPLTARYSQFGPADLPPDPGAYLGDRRLFVTGYFDLHNDPRKVRVNADDGFLMRQSVASDMAPPLNQRGADEQSIWPNHELDSDVVFNSELAWIAAESRYFAVVVHAPVAATVARPADVTPLQAVFPTTRTFVLPDEQSKPNLAPTDRSVLLAFESDDLTLAPNASADLSIAFFAGPRRTDLFTQGPYQHLNLDTLVRYEIPGPCTFCTFQWLARILLWFLTTVEGFIGDWGIAIILLVVTVRLILHPITKRAQVNMMKMGKQMQAIQPELEKLKKKYKDDQKKLSQEMWKLQREKGINPAGVLGCLPMLLQTPIWIALYAMLYYAIQLRHEPAFFGVFQALSNGAWPFLADLSIPDRLIAFYDEPQAFKFPLIPLVFDYSSFNILPILMGVTFYINMKFTTPPPTNDQQAQMQKIMRIIPFIFPFFLYAAPAGLTLYIFTSTLAGIIDSAIVRKKVREMEADGTLFEKKAPKPGGFRDRMAKRFEAAQAQMEALREEREKGQGGAPPGPGRAVKRRKK
ncbi:MAG: membrane protein insertase YidC [Planctomycetota bacterium]